MTLLHVIAFINNHCSEKDLKEVARVTESRLQEMYAEQAEAEHQARPIREGDKVYLNSDIGGQVYEMWGYTLATNSTNLRKHGMDSDTERVKSENNLYRVDASSVTKVSLRNLRALKETKPKYDQYDEARQVMRDLGF